MNGEPCDTTACQLWIIENCNSEFFPLSKKMLDFLDELT